MDAALSRETQDGMQRDCHFPMTGICHMPVHLSGLVSKYYPFASWIDCEPRIFTERHNEGGFFDYRPIGVEIQMLPTTQRVEHLLGWISTALESQRGISVGRTNPNVVGA